MNSSGEAKFMKKGIGDWISDHTHIIQVSEDTFEVATTEIDAYGDTIYCFVTKKDNWYQISDGGRILFKLDPGETDPELYQTAEEIAIGAGFDFDEKVCEISVTTEKENLVQAIVKLSQLQIAISYLG
ncbi:DUF1828 domain-containing protein [Lactobacillus hamsteri]|uniref:DUF1828 domain-containing protein n=1 Tax=Lactobacillus hamsteri DSM 5661 = JCM 6256 TaxID=1423754 RepID=A0A0R1Y4D6_9LACO|nr:DUF1828 domain-containing protein [Lactobacillus hamsteri]KRM37200.1 hypothetical protein FC39_GL000308 [Lactobacillus hamsteri DSM 5661 = JCM 6256]